MKKQHEKRHPKGVPYWGFKGDARAWRRHKRAEWKAVMKALDVFALGSAYTPCLGTFDGGRFDLLMNLAHEISSQLSPARWGK